MCRLALKSATKPFSPYNVLTAMEAMQEGYDGSGLGLVLRGLTFTDFTYRAQDPILSGIAHTEAAFHRLGALMQEKGFQLKYDHEFDVDFKKIEAQDRYKYFLRVYRLPPSWKSYDEDEIETQLMLTRLELRKNGEDHGGDLTAFSFFPDVATIKEVGWPLGIGEALGLNDNRIKGPCCYGPGQTEYQLWYKSMPATPSLSRGSPP